MLFRSRSRRLAGNVALGVAVVGAASGAVLALTHPAAAAGALAIVQSAVTCATTGACVTGTNTSSGTGVLGANTSSGIGVQGTGNGGPGVSGSSNSLYGVKGVSKTADGVLGQSSSGYGISGKTTTGFAGIAGTSPSGYGVYGFNSGNGGTAGVYGSSTGGYGVQGASGDTYGVYGSSTSGSAGVAGSTNSNTGVYGYTTSTTSGGTGVEGSSYNGFGVEGTTSSGGPGGIGVYGDEFGSTATAVEGISSQYALVGISGDVPLVLENASGTQVAFVNSGGDFYYSGNLVKLTAVKHGLTVSSFSPRSAAPTVEDTGTAQLVNGAAAVRLDALFAASIDTTTAYRVFITPDGDTPHGLFVATKTPAGFIVREAQGGRSTVSFDYRIVATALGQAGQRIAVTDMARMPHAPLPAITKLPPASTRR